jgi:hypothetical protein
MAVVRRSSSRVSSLAASRRGRRGLARGRRGPMKHYRFKIHIGEGLLVLMIFEDAHWSDPTSLEAFSRVIDRIADLRVLLVVTFRPGFAPHWIGQPHVSAQTGSRFDSIVRSSH